MPLSRDCDGCWRRFSDCESRYRSVKKGEFVYCPDGTKHMVDQ